MGKSVYAMAVRILRATIAKVGGVVLSGGSYEMLLAQRRRAVSELIELEARNLLSGVQGIVFSKDRALQLYTLLFTYAARVRNPAPLIVIYSVSSPSHAEAYDEVRAILSASSLDITFILEEAGFRHTLLGVLQRISTRNVFFLVDDIVFIRDLDMAMAAAVDSRQCILSFRHSPHLRYSYTASVEQAPPVLSPAQEGHDMLRFTWFEEGNEWSDPWSVDGQVLSTAEVRVLSRLSDYKAPNSYEGALKTFADLVDGRQGMCYAESKILNLAINRVQEEVSNCSGSISADFLLEKWSEGLMMDVSELDQHIPRSPHEDRAIQFVSRGEFPDGTL